MRVGDKSVQIFAKTKLNFRRMRIRVFSSHLSSYMVTIAAHLTLNHFFSQDDTTVNNRNDWCVPNDDNNEDNDDYFVDDYYPLNRLGFSLYC